jgi:hypothetical protein
MYEINKYISVKEEKKFSTFESLQANSLILIHFLLSIDSELFLNLLIFHPEPL